MGAIDLSEAAQVAAAAFAALAAAASWATVAHARKTWRAGARPHLNGQVVKIADDPVGPTVGLLIHNSGGGLAKGVGFLIVAGDSYVQGYAGTGFLRPGEAADIRTQLPPDAVETGESAIGMVACRDVNEDGWIWNMRGDRKASRRRWWRRGHRYKTGEEMLAVFHPDVDLSQLREVGYFTASG